MAIHYPNGKSYLKKIGSSNTKRTKNIVYGKRGMSLEDEINESNKYYLESGIYPLKRTAPADPFEKSF